MTGGTWMPGKAGGCIVTDRSLKDATRDSDGSIDYYGGALICESVRKSDLQVIAHSKEMYELLKEALDSCTNIMTQAAIKKVLNEIDGTDH